MPDQLGQPGESNMSQAVAVIGMTGRFPGAATVEEFWDNLCAGRVSIGRFDADELAASGVPERWREDPRYVPARGVLGDADLFDAGYFGFSPREAELTDPQQRLFLECVEEALQDAGYDSQRAGRGVGVFAGCTASSYQHVLREHAGTAPYDIGVRIGNDVDFLATRAAYKLNLTGPAVTVQSACSTGLVAVHLACQSLLDGECAVAIAGAASIQYPERVGYLYEPGSIASPDGHCRPFDAAARGTVGGSGVAVAVLKPLDDALADRDPIRAVILGTAINNDGAAKVGFTAPSVRGQRAVIRLAHTAAGVDPASIGYVEAHGTGTPLGDPIEVEALTKAFDVQAGEACLLGSVKANIGHLDAAAGMVGLLKTVLVVEHGLVPPTPHFTTPNPNARLAGGPFEVAAELRGWPARPGPRLAGVSSFGVGGTNAHAVIGEFTDVTAPASEPDGRPQLIPLSARDADTLERSRIRLAEHLATRPELALGDVANTMQTGRRELAHRFAVVASDPAGVSTVDKAFVARGVAPSHPVPVAFSFPGQGTEFAGMAGRLAAEFPRFAGCLDECLAAFAACGVDGLADLLLGEVEERRTPVDIELAQPALFAVQYALARLWRSWGVTPRALIGHSLGELTAAAVSGVFTLPDAAAVVARRGRLVRVAPEGAMCAVLAGPDRIDELLPEGVAVAAVNSPRATVVSGPPERIDEAAWIFAGAGLRVRRLAARRAFHHPDLEPAGEELAEAVAGCRLGQPEIPFVSGVTGQWITDEQATDPAYWASQLCRPVRFAAGAARLLDTGAEVVIEVGHGRTLTGLIRDGLAPDSAVRLVAGLPGGAADPAALLRSAGEAWTAGVPLDWAALHDGQPRRRLRLPTYPFDRARHTVHPGAAQERAHTRPALATGFLAPRNGLEERLAGIFADVLGVERVGIEDSFFDLGGDSLIAVRLLARVHDHYGLDLPAEDFFGAPTVAGLGDMLGATLEKSVEDMDSAQVAAFLAELEGTHEHD